MHLYFSIKCRNDHLFTLCCTWVLQYVFTAGIHWVYKHVFHSSNSWWVMEMWFRRHSYSYNNSTHQFINLMNDFCLYQVKPTNKQTHTNIFFACPAWKCCLFNPTATMSPDQEWTGDLDVRAFYLFIFNPQSRPVLDSSFLWYSHLIFHKNMQTGQFNLTLIFPFFL